MTKGYVSVELGGLKMRGLWLVDLAKGSRLQAEGESVVVQSAG